MDIVNLIDTQDISLDLVGGKAWNLGAMVKKGFPVPAGFVITSLAFQKFLEENKLLDYRHDVDFESAFMKASIPPSLLEVIESYYQSLHKHAIYAVAVRSSSALEDLHSASFAGQYETFLNIRSFQQLLMAIKRCWFSFFSPMVQNYAAQQQISLDSLNMGVLIQGMVAADVSGVIFSKNPVTNNEQEIMINASYGLGEGIVSGLVTPDQFLVHKATGQISRELGLKEVKTVSCEEGTKEVEITIAEQEVFCITDEEVKRLVLLTRQIEEHYLGTVDIEFAMVNGQIYLLQVRPITT